MNPRCGALPVSYVPVLVTRGTLLAHRYTYTPFGSRTSQHRMTFIPYSVSQCNDLGDHVSDGVALAGFKNRANASLLT